MRGRKPKPTALKLVTGNPGKRKLPKNEPQPQRTIPSPPAHMSPGGLVAWGRLSTLLDRTKVLTESEVYSLERTCEEYARILTLQAFVLEHGEFELIERTTGQKVWESRAQYKALCEAEKRFAARMADFGLTPASRSRVSTRSDDASHADPAAAYGL